MKTRTSLITLSIVTFLFLAGLGYQLWYVSNARQAAANALSDAEAKLGIDTWSRTMRSIQIEQADELAVIDKTAVSRAGLVNVVELIENTAKDLSLDHNISSIKDDPKQKSYVHLTIETNGAWEPTMRFLRLLGTLPYQVVVEDSSLNVVDGKWQSISNLRFTIVPEKS